MTKIGQLQPDYEQPCINTQTKTMFKEENKQEPERKPTPGEYVEVRSSLGNRCKRMYLFTNSYNIHYVVHDGYEGDYSRGSIFICGQFMDIRPLQTKQTYTIEATEEQYKKIQELIA